MSACLDELVDSLGSEDESTRRFAVEDLGDAGEPQAIGPLLDLLGDSSAAVREAVIEALSRIGGEETVVAALPALRSDNAVLRNAACVILQKVGGPAIVHLSRLLKDEDKDVRKFAVDVLAIIASPSARDALIGAMQDIDTNVAAAAAEALGRTGCASAVPAMVNSLKASSWMRCAIAKSLGRIGGEEAVRTLIELIKESDAMVVFVAVQALGAAGDDTSLQYLLYLLGNDNPIVVQATIVAIEAIIDRADPVVWRAARHAIPLEPVVRLVRHPKPAMRRSAIALLGRIGNADVVAPLVSALTAAENIAEQDIRAASATAIVSLAPQDVRPITDTLAAPSTLPEARCELADLLGRLGNPEAFDAVATLVFDNDVRVRRVAARCIARLDGERAVPILLRCLMDGDGHVRAHAARGLGSLLFRPALPRLIPLFNDPCEAVRQAVTWAVATLGGQETTDGAKALGGLLDDPYPDVRKAAAQALAMIGSPSAIDVLVEAAASLGESRRMSAVQGLAKAPDSERGDRALRTASSDATPAVQIEAIRALAARGCPEMHIEILAAMNSVDAQVRCAAVTLLTVQPWAESADRLLMLLREDPDAKVRYECARGLGHQNPPGAADALMTVLEDHDANPMVIIAAIESLGRIGDEQAIQALNFWMDVPDVEIAQTARWALTEVTRRVPLASI